MKLDVRLLTLTLASLGAAASSGAQQGPAIRPLGAIAATAPAPFGNVTTVRHLPGGRVLVNDLARRQVLMFDSTFANAVVVVDSAAGAANAYGPRTGGMIAYRGDSTLFIDPASMSMLLIDPSGKIARVMSVPRSQDAGALASAAFGAPGFDPAGRLIYRAFPSFTMPAPSASGAFLMPTPPDSAAIVRVDLATRKLDTVAFIKTPPASSSMSRTDDGKMQVTLRINPLPLADDWTVLPDGSIAVVRGRDYHIDWVSPDGTRSASPKVQYDWQRLSDEDKERLIDSVKAMRERMAASAPPVTTVAGGPGGGEMRTRVGGAEGGARAGGERMVVSGAMVMGGGGTPNIQINGANMAPPVITYVSPSELPDYKPPFFPGAVRADADGNVWVRTVPTKPTPGGPVYDVIDRQGTIVDRVQLPEGRTIVGFGAGTVYLATRDAAGVKLERARLK
jgi:hypothetical protein